MKKTLFAIATIAMMLVPSTAFAQSKSNSKEGVKTEKVCKKGDKKECKADKKECKADKKECCKAEKKGEMARSCDKGGVKGKPGKRFAKRPESRGAKEAEILQNLNLTQEQLTKVQALNTAREESRRELMNKARQARENGDTTFTFDPNAGKDINRKYLSDLKAVLTADQFTQFLTENYVNQTPRQNLKIDRQSKAGNQKRMAKKAKKFAGSEKENAVK